MKYLQPALAVDGFNSISGYFQVKNECPGLKEETKNKIILWGNTNDYKLSAYVKDKENYLCYKDHISKSTFCVTNNPIYINDNLVSMVNENCGSSSDCHTPLYLPIDYVSDTNITIQSTFCLNRISFPIVRNNNDNSTTSVHFYIELSPVFIHGDYDGKNRCMVLTCLLTIDIKCLKSGISNSFSSLKIPKIGRCLKYDDGFALPRAIFAYKTRPSTELENCARHKSFRSEV